MTSAAISTEGNRSPSHPVIQNSSRCGSRLPKRRKSGSSTISRSAVDRPRGRRRVLVQCCGLSHVDNRLSRFPLETLSRLASAKVAKQKYYHPAPPLRLLEGDEVDDAADAAADAWIQPSAISAASSLALLRFLPSYQKRAATVCPLMTTRLDQAVRPPVSLY